MEPLDKVTWLDLYDAGVPPSAQLCMSVDSVLELAKTAASEATALSLTKTCLTELCVIGLLAYFEASCKQLFAAVVNICPRTLEPLAARRDCSFASSEVLHLIDANEHRIGSLLSEHYDFGSAAAINAIFFDLLHISPFSKDEANKYSGFLNDRNLLVHHAGIFTFKYARQKFAKEKISGLAHWHSLTLSIENVENLAKFLISMAKKMAKASKVALNAFVKSESVVLDDERCKAIDSLDLFDI